MRVLFKKPNEPLETIEIENDNKTVQNIIGGYFIVLKIRDDIYCICDEDGFTKELSNNFYSEEYKYWILGNAIFCGMENYELISLTDEQIQYVQDYINSSRKS